MKVWYDAAMANELARKEEEEKQRKAKEEEERRLNEKKEREALNKELHDAMNARLDSMYEAMREKKQSGVIKEQKFEKLLKEVEMLRLAQGSGVRNDEDSTSRSVIRDDALLAKVMQEHEEMKAQLDSAAATNKRVEASEAALKSMK
ncbi:hypothetical protein CBR_g19034 [Chara braunii]|uniref:Uncharacterized protein n=1 Tax=Chara braunii TaxID=69332 RepID=A0A388KX63_CHABU|nr:hypothetical protein CBR_g19034 [Chara braunii]|eukprot:GBG74627.1 hypothetical protein CBR_g19034 [Chara braunii]